ncbi:FecR domain-containing protein [Stappia sp. MMSF_3263]|uniref:FecR family protein n=1 Tax=Stappia sp. MMSF_3263 TaxID=3046693 RepID=UPI00273F2D63|nr:FecR domain-containing protein [Stappia sp. MMSF_3263]
MTFSARLLATALVAGSLVSAQADRVAAADRVGVASAVNQSARSQVGGGAMKTVRIGKEMFSRERIATGPSGLVQVLLADGSNFVVGPNSSLVIDEFVYRPAEGQGKLVATFGRGVARYVGGKISKNRGGVTINTRQGTIGVRGGMANLVDRDGQTIFSFLFGKDLTFTGRNGKVTRVYRPGFSIVPSGAGGTSQRTPKSILALVNSLLSGNRPSGNRAGNGQLRKFSQVNSALDSAPLPRFPAPVLGQRNVPRGLLDLNHANSVILQETKQYCGYYC